MDARRTWPTSPTLILLALLFAFACADKSSDKSSNSNNTPAAKSDGKTSAILDLNQNKPCLSDEDVNEAVKVVLSSMAPVIQSLPRELIPERTISDRNLSLAVSAWKDPVLTLEVNGRSCNEGLSRDGLLLLLCHEIGHVAGGAPTRYFVYRNIPFSVEGQADYFATSVCLPHVMKNMDNSSFLSSAEKNGDLQRICADAQGERELALCSRISLASLNAAQFLHRIWDTNFMKKQPGEIPSLHAHEDSVVSITNEGYPVPQCRLDTYVAGLKCRAKGTPRSYVTAPDAETSCGAPAFKAKRPSCWYREPSS